MLLSLFTIPRRFSIYIEHRTCPIVYWISIHGASMASTNICKRVFGDFLDKIRNKYAIHFFWHMFSSRKDWVWKSTAIAISQRCYLQTGLTTSAHTRNELPISIFSKTKPRTNKFHSTIRIPRIFRQEVTPCSPIHVITSKHFYSIVSPHRSDHC